MTLTFGLSIGGSGCSVRPIRLASRPEVSMKDTVDPNSYAEVDRMHLEKVPHCDTRYPEVHEPVLAVKPDQNKTS